MISNAFHWLFNDFPSFYKDSQWVSLIPNDSQMFFFAFPIHDAYLVSAVCRPITRSPRCLPPAKEEDAFTNVMGGTRGEGVIGRHPFYPSPRCLPPAKEEDMHLPT